MHITARGQPERPQSRIADFVDRRGACTSVALHLTKDGDDEDRVQIDRVVLFSLYSEPEYIRGNS
jgi:hypothetical protein